MKNDQRIKKKDCKPADLKELLSKRVDPLQSFVEEVKSIFKSEVLPTALSHLAHQFGIIANVNVMDQIIVRVNLHYLENKVYDEKKFNVKIKKIEPDSKLIEILERASKLVVKVSNQLFNIKNYINKLVAQETPESRAYFRLKLTDVLKNFTENCGLLQRLQSEETVSRVLSHYYGQRIDLVEIYLIPDQTERLLSLLNKLPGRSALKSEADASLLEEVKKVQARIIGQIPS